MIFQRKIRGDLQPKPPKILMDNKNDIPREVKFQIQPYTTTKAAHPPIGFPHTSGLIRELTTVVHPDGDGEILRDEDIYLAHRAACSSRYPVRDGVIKDSKRQLSNSKTFMTPTKAYKIRSMCLFHMKILVFLVHLQIFDGMCHVLAVFSFTNSAKYAYRSTAEFARHVTDSGEAHPSRKPFPELHRPASPVWSHDYELDLHRRNLEIQSNEKIWTVTKS
ncbi:uncharacterized protein BT62DRAFT_657849 [Guyanagaster necrorhizus]|uniref:Uncharacterized protein n=1 Tax=Guyanagaster necrorhizus TaxID=856835 RepID=A0A9P8AWK2_9AGAR|nr:uncharacterized protein BT62DRAFT_657849 [Guyanagaster necrorhizus MCA 3950]KAG7449017.1 hypothetical protein BT62DRAFT_657849 [Guyanagaster necrorhizus MCA 3950]